MPIPARPTPLRKAWKVGTTWRRGPPVGVPSPPRRRHAGRAVPAPKGLNRSVSESTLGYSFQFIPACSTMASRSIPEKFHELVFELGSSGKSNRAIADHLGTLGIKTTHAAVGRLRRERREERSEIAKEVVREQLAPTLTADVRRLERLVKAAMNRVRGKGPNSRPDDDAFCKLAEQARKLIDTKLKYSGAADEGPPLNADLSKLTEAELERVAAGDFTPLEGGSAS